MDEIGERIRSVRDSLTRASDSGRVEDAPVRVEGLGGLAFRAVDPDGHAVSADMPVEMGGGGKYMTPGTLLRSALATCDAVCVAMQAAERGIELDRLEVEVESTSDRRGMLGVRGVVPGPIDMRLRYRLAADGVDESELRSLADDAECCSPVLAAVRNQVPVRVEVEIG